MTQPPEERRPPLTPQLALRVAIIGSVALAMFAIIFFRLWFLQVLSGDQYLQAATVNRVRDISVPAPRGEILDRNGAVMVDSTKALAVQISPPDLPVPVTLADIVSPPKRDAVIYNRLAHVVGFPTRRAACKISAPPYHVRLSPVACIVAKQVSLLPYADVTVKRQVSKDVQYYLDESQNLFPGVSVQQIYVTDYPMGTLAAQALGTVGPIDVPELKEKAYRGVSPNSIIGQTGLEDEYDSFLRGKDGAERVQVNALGQPTGDLQDTAPVAGHNLQLSLDANVERVGQAALAQSIASNPPADGGAFVALSPTDGEVYAMGSLPSFNPKIFTGDLSESTYKNLTSPASGDPLLNRAIQSAGPTGSTFKPITATAALESGAWTQDEEYDDTGQFCVGTGGAQQCRHNSGGAVDGVLNLPNALRVSSDDFFYNLGALTNADPTLHPNGGPLDQWARGYGIGRTTGVDLPDEVSGTLPTPRWRESRNQAEAECDSATGPYRYTNDTSISARKLPGYHPSPKHAPGGCGIADGTNRPWSIGDNINLAVGQGDVQVTPLQLAVVYSALANGGTIVRPHLGQAVEDEDGTVLQKIDPPPSRRVSINPIYLQTILTGLRDAASQPGGTSADVFDKFPEPVYGKTGTAQYITDGVEQDYAWYACFVPASATSKPIVVVVTVEKGGFGAVGAAPVAREILSQWFFGKPGPYTAGSSQTL
jgi:penicillin-binding protein 2